MLSDVVFASALIAIAGLIKFAPLNQPWWRALIMVSSAGLAIWGGWHQPWLWLPGLVIAASNFRLLKHRYGPKRERKVLLRSASWLALIVVLASLWQVFELGLRWLQLDTLLSLILVVAAGRALALTAYRNLNHGYRPTDSTSPKDLPTVTLAVPARNETHALTDHLRAAMASRYNKLEILILDDCSQDSTPDIVRSFANDGIRFVQGQQPANGWLGKNFAYQTLLDEASGDWLVFCGVDIRFEPDSIGQLVRLAQQSGLTMLSVMPSRRNFDWPPTVSRSLRYFWQMGFSTWPVMNSCWLVNRDWLLSQGGFTAHKHSIWPERALAGMARQSGTYGFVVDTAGLGVTTRKRASSLLETAKRTLYPLLHRELVWLAAKTAILASWLVLPWLETTTPLAVWLLAMGWGLLWLAFFISEMALQPKHWWLTGWFLPINLLNELWLGLVSAYGYEFGRVNWKGRNVCLPVLAHDSRER